MHPGVPFLVLIILACLHSSKMLELQLPKVWWALIALDNSEHVTQVMIKQTRE